MCHDSDHTATPPGIRMSPGPEAIAWAQWYMWPIAKPNASPIADAHMWRHGSLGSPGPPSFAPSPRRRARFEAGLSQSQSDHLHVARPGRLLGGEGARELAGFPVSELPGGVGALDGVVKGDAAAGDEELPGPRREAVELAGDEERRMEDGALP